MSISDRTTARVPGATRPAAGGPVLHLQRQCACGAKTSGLAADCEDCRKNKLFGGQAKLLIGAADDRFEREADRIADQVLTGQPRAPQDVAPLQVQRVNAGGGESLGVAPDTVQRVIHAPGHGLDASTRDFFESRFGHDFSRVRVHDDSQASRSAAAVSARAYTVGHDMVFASGQYRPGSAAGRRLIAHELTHVLQQSGKLQREAISTDIQYEETEDGSRNGGLNAALSTVGSGVLQRAGDAFALDDEWAGPWPEKDEAQRIRDEHKAEMDCRARTADDPAECDPARALIWADFAATAPAQSRFGAATWSGLRERTMNTADRNCAGKALPAKGVQGWFDPSRSWVKAQSSQATNLAANGCSGFVGQCQAHFDRLTAQGQTGTFSTSTNADPACPAGAVAAAATASTRAQCASVLAPVCTARAVAESARLLNHEDWHFKLSCAVAKKANAMLGTTTDFDAVLRGARLTLAAQQASYDGQTNHGCNAASQATWQTAIAAGLPQVAIVAQAAPQRRRR